MTTISDAADNAADYIIEHGHVKGRTGRPGTEACIRGALAWSNGVEKLEDFRDRDDKTSTAIADYLGLDSYYGMGQWRAVEIWNNAEERTQEEVVEVLRNVATKYRSDEMHG